MTKHAIRRLAAMLSLVAGGALAQPAPDSAPDAWNVRATLYGWFPDVRAHTNVTLPGAGNVGVDTRPDRYLSNLQFAFMGTLEARKGPWSFIGDAIYVDFDNTKSGIASIRGSSGALPLPVPVDAHVDLKAFVGELAAGYAIVQTPSDTLDVVGGGRYLRLESQLDVTLAVVPPGLPPGASAAVTKEFWDGVVGVRGRHELENRAFVSYYADVGGSSSNVTWQAFAGVGYHFEWGDALVGYRHLAYDFRGERPVQDFTFSGPLVGIGVRF